MQAAIYISESIEEGGVGLPGIHQGHAGRRGRGGVGRSVAAPCLRWGPRRCGLTAGLHRARRHPNGREPAPPLSNTSKTNSAGQPNAILPSSPTEFRTFGSQRSRSSSQKPCRYRPPGSVEHGSK